MDTNTPDIVAIRLNKGGNSLLVKLSQGHSLWGLDVRIADENPHYRRIRQCSELLRRFPEADIGFRGRILSELRAKYRAIEDYANFLFHTRAILEKGTNESGNRNLLWNSYYICEMKGATTQALAFFQDVVSSTNIMDATRGEAASATVRMLIEHSSSDEVLTFLEQNKGILERVVPKRFLLWKLKAHIYLGNYAKAVAMRDLIRDKFEGIEDDRTYTDLNRLVGRLRRNKARVSVDMDLEATIDEAKRLLNERNALGLVRFIRSTLDAKRSAVVETDIKELHTGALPAYMNAFAPFRELYSTGVRKHLKLLKNKLGYSARDIVRKEALLSLDPPSPTEGDDALAELPSVSSIILPPRQRRHFSPFVGISPGEIEIRAGEGVLGGKRTKEAPAGVHATVKGAVYLQNSRQISRVDGDRVRWTLLRDNSFFQETPDWRTFQIGNRLSPVADEESVYARLLTRGAFQLAAIESGAGREIWAWEDPEYVICSDPTLWKDFVVFIAKRKDAVSRYFILLVDRRSGTLKERYFLYSAVNEIPFHHHVSYVRFDSFLATPMIRDGTAYITSSVGLVLAFNLRQGRMLWTRAYRRTPYTVDDSLAEQVANRLVCSPIVGASHVLFAPIDSPDLLLLNRASGKLVTAESRFKWAECRPLGRETAFVADKDGNGYVLSLVDLSVKKAIRGAELTVVQSLSDGILIVRDRRLELWNEELRMVASAAIPSTFAPLASCAGACIGYDNSALQPLVGMLVDSPRNQADGKRLLPVEKTLSFLPKGRIVRNRAGTYLIADSYVVRLGKELEPMWSVPIIPGRTAVHEADSVVYLVSSRRVRVIEAQTGRVLSEFPGIGDRRCRIVADRLSPGGLLFATEPLDNSWGFVVRATPEGFSRLAHTQRLSVKAILDDGKGLLACHDEDIRVFRYRPENGTYELDEQAPRLAGARHYGIYTHLSDDSFLHVDGPKAHLLTPDRFSAIAIREWDDRVHYQWHLPDRRKRLADVMTYELYPHRITLLDTAKRKDFSSSVHFSGIPLMRGDLLIGVTREDRSKREYASTVFSTKSEKVQQTTPIKPPPYFSELYYADTADIFGNTHHFFRRYHRNSATEELGCVFDDLSGNGLRYMSFPPCRDFHVALSEGAHALLLVDNEGLRFTKDEFMKLLNGCAPVVSIPVDPAFDCIVDGYPDEWDTKMFHVGKTCAFYGALKEDDLLFAGIINDPRIVKSLARHGAGRNLRFIVMPAGRAGFSVHEREKYSLTGHCAEKGTDWQFAYSIPPDGSYCFIEMLMPLNKVLRYHHSQIKEIPTRDARGDVAFEFILKEDGETMSLFTPEVTKPLYFPRLKFKYPEQN